MARARNIKPGFFMNERLAECPALARLLFAGLWTIADREGRLEDRPKRIKAETLPYDDCDVDALLQILHDRGFIQRYTIAGEGYIQILTWAKHQNPHIKEAKSVIPLPPSLTDKNSTGTVLENSTSTGKAGLIPDSGFRIPDSLNRNPGDGPSPAVSLSVAMRKAGVEAQPADPRLIALAEQGVTPETITAACEDAKRKLPGKRVPPNYVFRIVEGWAEQAQGLRVSGAGPPGAIDLEAVKAKFRDKDAANASR